MICPILKQGSQRNHPISYRPVFEKIIRTVLVKYLKESAQELSEPLYIVWRHSLDNRDIAPLLKTAVICPILKQGSQRNHPKSYRPVSLTSHLIKVFERIIRTALVKYLKENDLLPDDQHGFIKGRSTLTIIKPY